MGQKYCTACGAALSEGIKFCEKCGSPVVQDSTARFRNLLCRLDYHPAYHRAVPSPEGGKGSKRTIQIVAILFLLIVVAGAGVSHPARTIEDRNRRRDQCTVP